MRVVLATYYVHPFYPLALYQLRECGARSGVLSDGDEIRVEAAALEVWTSSLTMESRLGLLLRTARQEPDVLAVSAFVWNRDAVLGLAREMCELFPRLVVVLGGPEAGDRAHATELLRREECLDYVVVGEGEAPFVSLLSSLKAGEPCAHPQVVGRRGTGVARSAAGPGPDSLALAANCSGHSQLWRERHAGGNIFLLETYRGCPYACAYCAWSCGRTRTYPIERVRAELEIAADASCRQVYFIDPFFGATRGHAEQLLRTMEPFRGRLEFSAFVRPGDVTDEFAELCRRVGLRPMNTGIQACSERGEQTIQRRRAVKQLERSLRVMSRHGLRARSVDLIYGIPGDSLDDLRAMIDRAADLDTDEINLHRLLVLPGTRLRALGPDTLVYQGEPPYAVLRTQTMSLDDIATAKRIHIGADWAQRFFKRTAALARLWGRSRLSDLWERFGSLLAAQPAVGLDFDVFDWVRKIDGLDFSLFHAGRRAALGLVASVGAEAGLEPARARYLHDLARFEAYGILQAQVRSLSGANEYHHVSAQGADWSTGGLGPWRESFGWDFGSLAPDADAACARPEPRSEEYEISIETDGALRCARRARADAVPRGAAIEALH